MVSAVAYSNRKVKMRRRRRMVFLHRVGIGFLMILIFVGALALRSRVWERSAEVWNDISGEKSARYPESLQRLLESNPEARSFVLDYPEKKDAHPAVDLSGEVAKGTIPLFLQWDERWGYENYGDDLLALTGCGPTCLSMVRCGLSGDTDWDPGRVAQMAQRQGYYEPGAGSSWTLMSEGAEGMGLIVSEVIFDEADIRSTLEQGCPIICSMGPGDFTTAGHFIVLTGVDEEGNITVCDPNSRKRSEKVWELSGLMSQIKNLWAYSYGE